MVGRVEGGGEPVSQPSDYLGGSKKVAFKFDRGMRGGCPLAQGSPVDEFGFWDREGDALISCHFSLFFLFFAFLCALFYSSSRYKDYVQR